MPIGEHWSTMAKAYKDGGKDENGEVNIEQRISIAVF